MTAPPIDVRVFQSLESCAHLRADIARLNEASSRPCPFSTFEFLANHVQYNASPPPGQDAHVLFLTAFRGDTLIGYLPLRRVADRLFGCTRQKIEYLERHRAMTQAAQRRLSGGQEELRIQCRRLT